MSKSRFGGQPLVNQSGQHVNKLTTQPVESRREESKYQSRTDREMLGLRLPRLLVQELKVYCVNTHTTHQDAVAEALVLFFANKAEESGQHVNKLTTCSVCSSSVCVCRTKSEEHTHTRGQPVNQSTVRGQPNLPGVGGQLLNLPLIRGSGSRYDLRTRRRYANAHMSLGANGPIPLGEGWIVRGQDGRYDELIEEWLAEESKPNPKNCPNCNGEFYVKKVYLDEGKYVRCTHPGLQEGK